MSWLGVNQEEFDRFKTEVNRRLNELKEAVQGKITDDEAAASLSAQNAKAAEQRVLAKEAEITAALVSLEKYRDQALEELQRLQGQTSETSESNKILADLINQNKQLHDQIISAKTQIDDFVSSISQSHAEISAA